MDADYKFIKNWGCGKQRDRGSFTLSSYIIHFATLHLKSREKMPWLTHLDIKLLLGETYDLISPFSFSESRLITTLQLSLYLCVRKAYPLLKNLLKPYSKQLHSGKGYFNTRISRACRIVEYAFGIVCSKRRALSKATETDVRTAGNIAKVNLNFAQYRFWESGNRIPSERDYSDPRTKFRAYSSWQTNVDLQVESESSRNFRLEGGNA